MQYQGLAALARVAAMAGAAARRFSTLFSIVLAALLATWMLQSFPPAPGLFAAMFEPPPKVTAAPRPHPGLRSAVTIPPLVGRDVAQATMLLQQRRLQYDVNVMPAAGPAGLVADQYPTAGDVEAGTTVELTVGAPQRIPVPDLTGQPAAAADAGLRNAQLTMRVKSTIASNQPANTVLKQEPAPGSLLPPGGNVLVVLAAPAATAVSTPVGP